MAVHESATDTMRAVRFHEYGAAADVLRIDRVAVPSPGPGRIRVVVQVCGLNPADWAFVPGTVPGQPAPRYRAGTVRDRRRGRRGRLRRRRR